MSADSNCERIVHNPKRTDPLICELTVLWEKSVRESHLFLTDVDIDDLRPFVRTGLYEMPHLILAKEGDEIVGFMGIAGDQIEMLFLAQEYCAKGIGKELVRVAIDKYRIRKVDVNEQNPKASGFYKHLGFEVFERTDYDEQGMAFPILKMHINS